VRTRKLLKRTAIALAALLGLGLVAGGGGAIWLHGRLRASLPSLRGETTLPGLTDPVVVERDAQGVPTVTAANRLDRHRAIGFLHGQDRFFQMDLMRRKAAGELAALVGEAAVPLDREVRVHRFRARAEANLRDAGDGTRAILAAYTTGVNAGLAALGADPPEYLALRMKPEAWVPEDSTLVLMAMYLELQSYLWPRESSRGVIFDVLPRELAEFLLTPGTEWDAPLVGEALATPPVPGARIFDLRLQPVARSHSHGVSDGELAMVIPGSNSWAVAGRQTADGGALLANDMHLPLGLPNIWYRLCVRPKNEDEEPVDRWMAGVTLPGVPVIVAGSTGRVAWGFTNSNGDWADLITLEPDPSNPERYLTVDGPQPFERHEEIIRVAGGEEVVLEVTETIWGPVIDEDHRGRRRALRWVAHETASANIALVGLESARTIEEALEVANRSGMPAQNFVVADEAGRIAWTLAGMIPRRDGGSAALPVPWSEAGGTWKEWLEPEEYPRIVDPASGRLWTANNRVVDSPTLDALGDGGFDLGARAQQIRDGLFAIDGATARDLLAVQLDDRALFLERWRDLLLGVLNEKAVSRDDRRAEMRRLVETGWTGRASVDSVGYRLVRGFRLFLAEQVFETITRSCKEADGSFAFFRATPQWEGPLWRLVTERPLHLLDPRFASWDAQLLAAVDATLDYFLDDTVAELAEATWGRRNTVRIRHPLSLAVPQLSSWLDLAPRSLPGDSNMPRVQSPGFGASERFVVSPGREEQGILHTPGGASGHPLSPYYREGHEAWAGGEATPFLPGPALHTLKLVPAG
jgi:penicillin amidase